MKEKLSISLSCLMIAISLNSIFAQQGNVAAGGNAIGPGGSMSYSIGQTDYLMYSSDEGSLSFGLQQTWTTDYLPPLNLEISDLVISSGENICFDAIETVTVAGEGDLFIVAAYGHADIIAGHNIILKHGTSVELYGSLHARISNVWCPPHQSLLASFYEEPEPIKQSFEPLRNLSFFSIYPNPTSGDFTLELQNVEEASLLLIEIYTMQGNLISRNELPTKRYYNFSLAGRQPGVYLIRVLKDQEIGTRKIIRK